jgi:hypothetical protein
LKFNRPFEKRRAEDDRVMRYNMPLLGRFLTKLVHDILPAVLASVIGGFLFTHFQLGRAPEPAVAVRAAPASTEMMQLLRDEHGLILNFLKAELASEKRQLAVADSAPPAAADITDIEPPAAVATPRQVVAMVAAKPVALRSKTPVIAAPLPPLVIAQAQQTESVRPAAANPDTILSKTIGIKDHVVAATHRVVSAIGGIPSWIGSIGDRIGGEDSAPRPPANLISAS